MAGRVLRERGEDVAEDGFQGGHGERDQRPGYFGVFDTQHGVVGPAAVGVPLADDD